MANLIALRLSGKTYALTLTTAPTTAALLVESETNVQTNFVALLNTGSDTAAVELANTSDTVKTPAIASSGSGGSFVLPGGMTQPVVIAAPKAPFYIKGISSGSNTLYITPIQSD